MIQGQDTLIRRKFIAYPNKNAAEVFKVMVTKHSKYGQHNTFFCAAGLHARVPEKTSLPSKR